MSNLVIPILLLGSLSSLIQSSYQESFDCTGILGKSTLQDYNELCIFVVNSEKGDWRSLSMMNRLDVVKTCTCNLVDKTLVWDSMLTHEVESMYHAVRLTILENKSRDADAISQSSMLTDPDFSDNKTYLFDLFSGIAGEHPAKSDGVGLCRKFEESFSKVYYSTDSMSLPYLDDPDSDSMRLILYRSCQKLFNDFDIFKTYFDSMSEISGNKRFFYRVMENYPTIYKLTMVRRMCQYLKDADEFLE